MQSITLSLISIHAPPRGATDSYRRHYSPISISIHAPPRGATPRAEFITGKRVFQFTPLREGRRSRVPIGTQKTRISIHAPPRGATSDAHAPRRRPTTFQFTPLREGRHKPGGGAATTRHFNSRPSARGDTRGSSCWFHVPISIHAPPRGATAKDMQFLQIFCSTLTNQHGLTIVPRNLSRLFW